jgi:hypothetical protein
LKRHKGPCLSHVDEEISIGADDIGILLLSTETNDKIICLSWYDLDFEIVLSRELEESLLTD